MGTFTPCYHHLLLTFLLFILIWTPPLISANEQRDEESTYLIGTGIYDITGPPAESGMLGYAQFLQRTSGIHMRLYSRAFIIGQSDRHIVIVVADLCFITQDIVHAILARLSLLHGPDLYTKDNVMISPTHTHAGPGGYSRHILYQITTFGFDKQNFETIVHGILESIERAHANLASGRITYNIGQITNSSINRSLSAYLANPVEERMRYGPSVDTEATILRLTHLANPAEGKRMNRDIGMLSWFPVHGTSLDNRNTLISGDNKGYAAYLFEKEENGDCIWSGSELCWRHQHSNLSYCPFSPLKNYVGNYIKKGGHRLQCRIDPSQYSSSSPHNMSFEEDKPGHFPFVAGLAQANEGDITPNTRGAFCANGKTCGDAAQSKCTDRVRCHGRGPGINQYASCEQIGYEQYRQLRQLYNNAKRVLRGDIRFVHIWKDMQQVVVSPAYSGTGVEEKTCIGALGDSFGAGTTDGPGCFNFVQGTAHPDTNLYWNWLFNTILKSTTPDDVRCHHPKPILLFTGGLNWPARFTMDFVPLQILKIGQFWILGIPAEVTTMAGRRLKESTRQVIVQVMQEMRQRSANNDQHGTIGFGGEMRQGVEEMYSKASKSSDDQGKDHHHEVRNPSQSVHSEEVHVVISGIANGYSHYVTTREEYNVQRYEGASTLFGPFTLAAYQMLFADLARHALFNTMPPFTEVVKEYSGLVFNQHLGVIEDSVPNGRKFGDINRDVKPWYYRGQTVHVEFWTAHPRNNLRINGTFLAVEQLVVFDQLSADLNFLQCLDNDRPCLPSPSKQERWVVVANDGDWETVYRWRRIQLTFSIATVEWSIPFNTPLGTYRIRHFGDKKQLFGTVSPFQGVSSSFRIIE